jgi:hypothetical protein
VKDQWVRTGNPTKKTGEELPPTVRRGRRGQVPKHDEARAPECCQASQIRASKNVVSQIDSAELALLSSLSKNVVIQPYLLRSVIEALEQAEWAAAAEGLNPPSRCEGGSMSFESSTFWQDRARYLYTGLTRAAQRVTVVLS